MSIRKRLGWLLVSWSLFILLAANAFTYFAFVSQTEDRELEAVEDVAEGILDLNINLTDSASRPLLKSVLPDDGMIRVLDQSGNILLRVADEDDTAHFHPAKYTGDGDAVIKKLGGEQVALIAIPVDDGGSAATLEVSRSLSDLQEDLRTLLLTMLSVSLVLLIASVFIGRFIANRFLKPVSHMSSAMNHIKEKGQLKHIELPNGNHDELYELAQNFNRMIDSLEEVFAKQEQFIGDASHELKTPLTVIENYASMLDRWGKNDPELLDEGLTAIRDESGRMKRLTEQLLNLASMNEEHVEKAPADIIILAEQTVKRLERATGRKIIINSNHEKMKVMTNEEQLIQILFILLDNALKYSEAAVMISIARQGNQAFIEVRDKGIGIPSSEIPKLFERFYRVDSSRTRATGGSGLGLAIARELAEKNGGTLRIESMEGEGTTATLVLPAAEEL